MSLVVGDLKEKWTPIIGFEDLYMISNLGRVKSLHKRNYGNILKTWDNKRGYEFCNLCKKGEKKINGYIHRLVAEHFLMRKEEYNIVNHIDGNRKNNREDNLEWCDQDYNVKHASKLGLLNKGEECATSKLTNEDVLKIRELSAEGASNKDLSVMFNIDSSVISRIKNRKAWKHI